MTAPMTSEPTAASKPRRRVGRGTILLLGVFVIPFALSVALNGWGGPLTAESALRIAGATVAGQTIAILSAVTAVVLTVTRRYALPAILGFIVIAAVITAGAISNMSAAGELLLTRLELVAGTDQLNQ